MIRVLALNDDNHETSYTTEEGQRFYSASEFITKVLAKPHTEEYIVRGYAIIDEPEGALAALDEDEIITVFDQVANDFLGKMSFEEAFNLLWESSDERWY